MFQTLKRLYNSGQLTDIALLNSIKKSWISKEQALQINPNLDLSEIV